jgi:hypothetical protein
VTSGISKLASVIDATEFVNARVGFSRKVTGLEQKIRSITNREIGAGRILLIRIFVAGHDRALNIKLPCRRETQLGPWGACRIKGFIDGTEQVSKGVPKGFYEPGATTVLIALKIQTS